jgi:glycosyltransferase involved in cell wall biosynthesis
MTSPHSPGSSLSVITPSYNYERFLPSCLQSVCRQDSPWSVRHLAVDDGSTDGSWPLLQEMLPGSSFRQENVGLSRTLDRLMRLADGDVVCWLNADDFHLPWTYRTVHDAFRRHPEATIVYGDTVFVDDDDRLLRLVPQPAFDRSVMEGGFIMFHVPSVFFRRDAVPDGWTFDASMRLYMDLDLWLTLTPPGTTVVKVDAVLSAFRRHAGQVSATSQPSDADEVRTLATRHRLPHLMSRHHGGWSRASHARHGLAKVVDGGAARELSAMRRRGLRLDWTAGAELPQWLAPTDAVRLRSRVVGPPP